MSEPKSVAQKREELISLLQDIDYESQNNSAATFYSLEISAKSTRLGWIAVKQLYQILAEDDAVSTWGQTANELRDRLRLNVLNVHGHEDPFDGRPLRSAELEMAIVKLEQYQETEQ